MSTLIASSNPHQYRSEAWKFSTEGMKPPALVTGGLQVYYNDGPSNVRLTSDSGRVDRCLDLWQLKVWKPLYCVLLRDDGIAAQSSTSPSPFFFFLIVVVVLHVESHGGRVVQIRRIACSFRQALVYNSISYIEILSSYVFLTYIVLVIILPSGSYYLKCSCKSSIVQYHMDRKLVHRKKDLNVLPSHPDVINRLAKIRIIS